MAITMTQHMLKSAHSRGYFQSCLPLLIACLCLLIQPAASVVYPMQHQIRARHTQCIYERFEHGAFATFEIFIVEAPDEGRPQAAVQIEGPVASPKIGELNEAGMRTWTSHKPHIEVTEGRTSSKRKANTMGAAMQDSIENWPDFLRQNHKHFSESGVIHHAFHLDYTYSGQHEDAIAMRADLSREKMEERRQRKLAKHQRKEGGEYRGDENVDEEEYEEESGIQQIIPEWIEPYEWTKPIKAAGWYRMCVQAENAITAELDIRSSAALGGIDPETWHVYTHEEREAINEQELIDALENEGPSAEEIERKLVAEEVEKALKDQVSNFDLESTKKLLEKVNTLVSDLRVKQQNVHHRIKGHEGDAKRAYKRIVRSGQLETLLYVVITCFQVYTVHKWLLGSNMLGR